MDQAEEARTAQIVSQYNKYKEGAESDALIADVSLSLSIAAIATGLYLWFQEDRNQGQVITEDTRIEVELNAESVHLGYTLSF